MDYIDLRVANALLIFVYKPCTWYDLSASSKHMTNERGHFSDSFELKRFFGGR